jgi:SnoaL-like polyketide cyclase
MTTAPALSSSEAVNAVVWRNTEEVQTNGRFDVFDELFADDFVDHTPQPDSGADKEGVRDLYKMLRAAFPDFPCQDTLAACRRRHGDDLQDLLRDP